MTAANGAAGTDRQDAMTANHSRHAARALYPNHSRAAARTLTANHSRATARTLTSNHTRVAAPLVRTTPYRPVPAATRL